MCNEKTRLQNVRYDYFKQSLESLTQYLNKVLNIISNNVII